MENLISTFLEFVYQSRSLKTHSTYKQALQVFFETVGDVPLTKDTYIKFLETTSDMNPATQALYRSVVKSFYQFSADHDPSIQTSFFQEINKRYALKVPDDELTFNKDGIDKIIQYCNTIRNNIQDYRDRAFIFVLADTGLRISEACSLRIGSIDWNEAKAHFIGKGGKKASVHVSNRAVDALREYLKERDNSSKSLPLFMRHDKKVGDEIKPVEPGGMWKVIKQRAIEAGVDPFTVRPHDFRHYFVTTVYTASRDIKLAKDLARHKRIETTARYTHFVDDSGEAYNEIFNRGK